MEHGYLVFDAGDGLGILLEYQPPYCTMDSMTKLAKLVLEVVLRKPSLNGLGDFTMHTKVG